MAYCISILSSEWDCVIFQSKDWVLKFFCNNHHCTQLREFNMEEALSKPLKDWNVSSFFQTYCLTNSFLFHMKILKGLLYYKCRRSWRILNIRMFSFSCSLRKLSFSSAIRHRCLLLKNRTKLSHWFSVWLVVTLYGANFLIYVFFFFIWNRSTKAHVWPNWRIADFLY